MKLSNVLPLLLVLCTTQASATYKDKRPAPIITDPHILTQQELAQAQATIAQLRHQLHTLYYTNRDLGIINQCCLKQLNLTENKYRKFLKKFQHTQKDNRSFRITNKKLQYEKAQALAMVYTQQQLINQFARGSKTY